MIFKRVNRVVRRAERFNVRTLDKFLRPKFIFFKAGVYFVPNFLAVVFVKSFVYTEIAFKFKVGLVV
jgi:hypothetical protein